jgi:ATP-binding cassette subfamily B protein RaxB
MSAARMPVLDNLALFNSRLPVVMQADPNEAALACVIMVAGFYGKRTSMVAERERSTVLNNSDVQGYAAQLGLETRSVRAEISELKRLKLPCILQWDSHFVVLKKVGVGAVTVHDPARGICKHSIQSLAELFSGIAIELWPAAHFTRKGELALPRLRDVTGHVSGWMRSFVQILLLAIVLEIFTLPSPLFLQWVLDSVISSADFDLLTMLALGFAMLMVLQVTVTAVRSWAILYSGTLFKIQWRSNVFAHLLRLPLNYFGSRGLGDIASRFDSVEQIHRTLTSSSLEVLLDGFFTILTLVIMFAYSPTLAWIVIAAAFLYVLLRAAWHYPTIEGWQAALALGAVQHTHFLESVRCAKTIKFFQGENQRRTAWLALVIDHVNSLLRIEKLRLAYTFGRGLLAGLENVVIIWMGARMVMDGHFTVGAFVAFNAYRLQFDTRIIAFIDKIIELQLLRVHIHRLSDIVSSEAEPEAGQANIADSVAAEIAVSNLRFRYSNNERYVLDGVSFHVAAGESVAIVGASGCGKTTLINIIGGALTPTEGDVLVNGECMKRLGPQWIRRAIGIVCQDDALLTGSIAENIGFFDAKIDHHWVEECARNAAIHQEICAMPRGYKTLIGEAGSTISGGQKQRILLARALYKRPKILILDEATSHLDVERERLVNEAVRMLKLTRIIVAHRPETIASADRQIVLDRGKVVERLHAVHAAARIDR